MTEALTLIGVCQLQREAIASMHYTVSGRFIPSGRRCHDPAIALHDGKLLCYPHFAKVGGALAPEEPEWCAKRWRRIEREGAAVR